MTVQDFQNLVTHAYDYIASLGEESYTKYVNAESIRVYNQKAKDVYRCIRALGRRDDLDQKEVEAIVSCLMQKIGMEELPLSALFDIPQSIQYRKKYVYDEIPPTLTEETDPTVPAFVKDISSIQIGNWDTAFGWGDHSLAGYISAESDPTVGAHIKAITVANITNWNTAFGWGNHGAAGYLTAETDPTVGAHIKAITAGDIANWNNAYTTAIRSGANLGTGIGVYDSVSGTTMRFKTLKEGSPKVSIVSGLNEVTLDVVESSITHDNLVGVTPNQHVDHSTIDVIAGLGLSGGGAITSDVTLSLSHLGIQNLVDPNTTLRYIRWNNITKQVEWATVGGGGGSTIYINDLVDVTVVKTGLNAGAILMYDGVSDFDAINVSSTIPSPPTGQRFLGWNGSQWADQPAYFAYLSEIVGATPNDKDVIYYSGTYPAGSWTVGAQAVSNHTFGSSSHTNVGTSVDTALQYYMLMYDPSGITNSWQAVAPAAMAAQINHNLLLNTHNLTTDIDHDALTNFVAQEHIRWDLTGAEKIHVNRLTEVIGIADLSDVAIGTEVLGQLLFWGGSSWGNAWGQAQYIEPMRSSTPANYDVMYYHTTGGWQIGAVPGFNHTLGSGYHTNVGTSADSALQYYMMMYNPGATSKWEAVSPAAVSAQIDHNLLTNTHNLTTDINHDALTNFVAQEHIRWDLTGAEKVHVNRLTEVMAIADLSDVATSAPSLGQLLFWGGSSWGNAWGQFQYLEPVRSATPSTNDVVKYNGAAWVVGAIPTPSLAISDLTDVPVYSAPQALYILRVNSGATATEWVSPSAVQYWTESAGNIYRASGKVTIGSATAGSGLFNITTSSNPILAYLDGSGNAANTGIKIISTTTTNAFIHFGDTAADSRGRIVYANADDSMQFSTSASLACTIASNGQFTFEEAMFPQKGMRIPDNFNVVFGTTSLTDWYIGYNSTSTYGYLNMRAEGNFVMQDDGVDKFTFDLSGTSSGVATGLDWTATSDRIHKYKFEKFTKEDIDKIYILAGKATKYYWREDFSRDGRLQYGHIAQDVHELFPSLVSKSRGRGDLSLSYGKMSSLALVAIGDLNRRVISLEKEIRKLKRRK